MNATRLFQLAIALLSLNFETCGVFGQSNTNAIPATEARNHIGETLSICGRIVHADLSGKYIVFSVDSFSHPSLYVFAPLKVDYWQKDDFNGKRIVATGNIEMDSSWGGTPKIIVSSSHEIWIEGKWPVPARAITPPKRNPFDQFDKPAKQTAKEFLDAPDWAGTNQSGPPAFDPSKPYKLVDESKPQFDWGELASRVGVILLLIAGVVLIFYLFRLFRYVWMEIWQLIKELGETNPTNLGGVIAKLITAVLLFMAAGRHDYDYYTLLRCMACGVAAFTAFQVMQTKKFGWLFVFVIVAIILNPIVPLHLKRSTWAFVDATAALLLLASVATIEGKSASKSIRRFLFWCLFLLGIFGVVTCCFLSQNMPEKNANKGSAYEPPHFSFPQFTR